MQIRVGKTIPWQTYKVRHLKLGKFVTLCESCTTNAISKFQVESMHVGSMIRTLTMQQ